MIKLHTTVLGRRVLADDWIAVQGDRALKILLDWTLGLASFDRAKTSPLNAATIADKMLLSVERVEEVLVELLQRRHIEYDLDGPRIRNVWMTRDGLYHALNCGGNRDE